MHINLEKTLRRLLIVLAIYLIGDGIVHLSNTRLLSVIKTWPASALAYARLLDAMYASFVFLAALLMLIAQRSLKKYQTLIIASSIWAIFHGFLLIYLSSTQNFTDNFSGSPSLYVWIPFYNQYLLVEASLAFIYAILVFIWIKND